jgi:hypothetical protein
MGNAQRHRKKYWSKCGPLDYSPPPCKASLMGSSPVFVTVTAFTQSIEDNSRSNENGQRQLIVRLLTSYIHAHL